MVKRSSRTMPSEWDYNLYLTPFFLFLGGSLGLAFIFQYLWGANPERVFWMGWGILIATANGAWIAMIVRKHNDIAVRSAIKANVRRR